MTMTNENGKETMNTLMKNGSRWDEIETIYRQMKKFQTEKP